MFALMFRWWSRRARARNAGPLISLTDTEPVQIHGLASVAPPSTSPGKLPPWMLGQLLRAAYWAGAAQHAGATTGETERLVHIVLGETGGVPQIRDARRNKAQPNGRRYADVGVAQVNLVHHEQSIDETEPGRRTDALVVAARLMSMAGLDEALERVRRGDVFFAERRVRDGADEAGRLKRMAADRVMVEVRRIDAAMLTPIGPDIELAPLGDRSP